MNRSGMMAGVNGEVMLYGLMAAGAAAAMALVSVVLVRM